MNREEAKEVIEDIIIDVRRTTAEEDKALRMAIEALSADTIEFDFNKYQPSVRNKVYDKHEAVNVVRCKDCKWYKLTDHNETEVCTNKQWDISMAVYPIISANDYCSYGERREP